jgi:4-hydroxy-2-oxoheptanedioate aldolase
MRKSRVKNKLKNNEPALITCLHLMDASVYELVSIMGFDGIWVDMEHHGHDMGTVNHMMRAARVGVSDIMCRPAKGEFMRMGRMLEAGAHGILYPRCDDATEAKEVVRWSKFAPLGTRGFDGGNPDMPYCMMDPVEYLQMANDETWIAVQIEDQRSLENAEEMAAVDGVDVLFLGPSDFSILSGVPGQFDHPKLQNAVEKIAQAAKNQGKHWGMPSGTPERTKELLDLGATLICHGADIMLVKTGLENIQKQMSPLGFTFGE